MPVLAPERLVKCPTEHCPGWIALEDGRPQTVPCRYCRVTAHTLSYLLSQIGERELAVGLLDIWAPKLHEQFNNLVLQLAGTVHNNVYIRPMDRALVTRSPGRHGESLEYNPEIAAVVGGAPMIALMLHELLHFELHQGEDRPLQITIKPTARDKDFLAGPLNYLRVLADHLWLAPRMDDIAPMLRQSMQEWGLDIALFLSGNESFFLPYIDDRNRRWLIETIQQPGMTAETMRDLLIERLADLTQRFFGAGNELLRRTLLAVEIADLKLNNPAAAERYSALLQQKEIAGYQEVATIAQRLADELASVRSSTSGKPSATDFRRAVEGGIGALGLANYAEVFGQKK